MKITKTISGGIIYSSRKPLPVDQKLAYDSEAIAVDQLWENGFPTGWAGQPFAHSGTTDLRAVARQEGRREKEKEEEEDGGG